MQEKAKLLHIDLGQFSLEKNCGLLLQPKEDLVHPSSADPDKKRISNGNNVQNRSNSKEKIKEEKQPPAKKEVIYKRKVNVPGDQKQMQIPVVSPGFQPPLPAQKNKALANKHDNRQNKPKRVRKGAPAGLVLKNYFKKIGKKSSRKHSKSKKERRKENCKSSKHYKATKSTKRGTKSKCKSNFTRSKRNTN